MSFLPAIPSGGLAGWRFLERTAESQRATFERQPMLQREIRYFEENIGKITSAEALVKDRRLLKVALGAFGLDAEIDKRFFVRRVLESDIKDPRSMANRLSVPGFKRLAEAFGFAQEKGPNTGKPAFVAEIVERYKVQQFEQAVGQVDDTLRLAMNFRREIVDLAANAKEGTGWFAVLGSRPLRAVVETALGLPKEFGRIDVDRQRDMVRARMSQLFGSGSLEVFKDPANVETLVNRYLARAQIESGLAGGASSPVLQLFQAQGPSQAEGLFSILLQRR